MKHRTNSRILEAFPTFARFCENVQETKNLFSRDIEATVQSFYQTSPDFVIPDLTAKDLPGRNRENGGSNSGDARFKPAGVLEFSRKKS